MIIMNTSFVVARSLISLGQIIIIYKGHRLFYSPFYAMRNVFGRFHLT